MIQANWLYLSLFVVFKCFLSEVKIFFQRLNRYFGVWLLQLKEEERRLKIPQQFLFVGTMNEDETTQSLSDKVLDRANVLTFGKPNELQLRQQNQTQNFNGKPSGYLTYSNFQNWTKRPESNSEVVKEVRQYVVQANQVMEKMGHPFAHRVYQAIIQYIVNYPTVDLGNFKLALADQFGQKLLPKLRGVMIDEFHEELEELQQIITEIGDNSLTEAYIQARQGRYGQFYWQGLVYQDEPAT
jgi:5-methylcytosine-specific restriction endonuclease McrBC GTP-binding regulatory subunit McrB